ncbi:thioredoxin [Pseudobacillus badius]|uniref:thioredoxin n=1 Tax=Bacillus badius TaxID=1455 RepID=UPI0007B332E8|nr:thioredoxin [Bacillus badius]KZR57917.1 thiol reductase thioredoxin [Bacillus badius]
MLEITTVEQFNEEVLKGLVLVDFFASWCGPCKMITPSLEELSKKITEVKFVKVNVDELKEVADDNDVMSVPTLLLFKDGDVIDKRVGFLPTSVIEEFLKLHLKTA